MSSLGPGWSGDGSEGKAPVRMAPPAYFTAPVSSMGPSLLLLSRK